MFEQFCVYAFALAVTRWIIVPLLTHPDHGV